MQNGALQHVIVGTAGHIDHGKSSLVEALTGTHPDRLEEEKRRGITIDLGFAFLERGSVRLGFVDVPGHERFVKNMLAGVGGIDVVLLVIAADESIKPQTREHFDICRLLEIPRGLVALTKSDLVSPETLGLVRLEVEEFLRGSFLVGANVVPVSARTGDGLDVLTQHLFDVAASVPVKDASQHFRLPIDRAFAMKGFGAVVTGTLISGSVAPEDEVELFPARRRFRVRGVHSGGRTADRAFAGQRTAVNLSGLDLAEVHRGDSLASPGIFEPTTRLDAKIQLLPSARPLKHGARVHFHQGTAETVAEVSLLEGNQLAPGAEAFAQFRLAEPALLIAGDRFILRQFSPLHTIGGGVVVDPIAPRHRRKDAPAVLPRLAALATGDNASKLLTLVTAQPEGLDAASIIRRTGWLPTALRKIADAHVRTGALRILTEQPLVLCSQKAFAAARAELLKILDDFHRANPLAEGIPREDLRARLSLSRPELFRALVEDLTAAAEIAATGDLLKRAGRTIALQPEEARARDQIEAAFAAAGLTVPPLADVLTKLPVEPARARKLLQLLLRDGVLVKISEDLVFHRDALAKLRQQLAAYKRDRSPRITVPAFKELAGVSRKYAIPLLEYLDRERVTRRSGDERLLL